MPTTIPDESHSDILVLGEHGRVYLANNAGIAQMPQTKTAADLALTAEHRGHMVVCDTTDRNINITAPPSSADMNYFMFAVKNARGAMQVNIRPSGADNLDGKTDPIALVAGEHSFLSLAHGDTNWEALTYKVIAIAAFSTESIDAPTTIDETADGKLYDVDVTGGNITQPLPAIGDVPPTFKVGFRLNREDSGNELTLTPNGSNTINGQPEHKLNEHRQVVWLAPVGGHWAVIYDYNPLDPATKATGEITITPGTPVSLNHALGRRPVPITFMHQATNRRARLGVEYPDEATALVDGNLAATYLYEAG